MADQELYDDLVLDTDPDATDRLVKQSGSDADFDSVALNNVGMAKFIVTTAGDIIYATAAKVLARLGIGTAGKVLRVNSGATAPEWGTVGIADNNIVEIDHAAVADNDYAKFTANGLEGRSYAEVKQDLDLEIGTDVLAQQTIGIADNNLVEIDHASVADNDYAKFTANGLEGRSYAEVAGDIQASIDHDSLSNFVANEHLDWTQTGVGTVHINNIADASLTAQGVVELATAAETSTGTDATRAVTPDGLAGSEMGTKHASICVFETDTAVSTGDGVVTLGIPYYLNGWDLVDAIAIVEDQGVTGTTDIQLSRRRSGTDVDMLSTKITIAAEYFARDGVINTSNDDVATGDLIYIDVDAVHSGTAPNGLTVVLSFRKP